MSKLRTPILLSYRTCILLKRNYCDYKRRRQGIIRETFLGMVYDSSLFIENSSKQLQAVSGIVAGCSSGVFLGNSLGTFGAIGISWLVYILLVGARRHIIATEWRKKGHYGPYQKIGQRKIDNFKVSAIGGFIVALLFR